MNRLMLGRGWSVTGSVLRKDPGSVLRKDPCSVLRKYPLTTTRALTLAPALLGKVDKTKTGLRRRVDADMRNGGPSWYTVRMCSTNPASDLTKMFTTEEALKFISENLEVRDFEQRFQNDRRSLLDEITTSIQTHFVFQNLRLLQNVPEKRRRPSLDQIKADFVAGYGGLCYNLNTSAYFLLKAVGFKSSIALSTVTKDPNSYDNHVVVYVADVEKPGDSFLVEAGLGLPTFRAVSLDFENESPYFVDSFLEYKYIKYKGKILRMHNERDVPKKINQTSADEFNLEKDGWSTFYYANPEGCENIEELHQPFHKVFTDPLATPFHVTFRIIGFPGKKAVMVVNGKILIENDKGELVPTLIEGGDEGIVQAVRHHFPVLPEDLVRRALASWRQAQ